MKRANNTIKANAFHGLVLLNDLSVAVDNFTGYNGNVYFLSHMHKDHIKGLHSSWCKGVIYCSRATSKLIHYSFPNIPKSAIKALTLGTPHVIDCGQNKPIAVTLFDAGHCPGSCMFLFEYTKRALYTGDIRAHNLTLLEPLFNLNIDILYLDTTFISLNSAPTIDECAYQTLEYIRQLKINKTVFVDNTILGVESLLVFLSKHLNTYIHVSKYIFDRAMCYDPNVAHTAMTTSAFGCHIHCGCDCKRNYNATIIRPSALWHLQNSKKKEVVHMLYVTHSPFNELKQIVNAVQPQKIINITACDEELYKLLSGGY